MASIRKLPSGKYNVQIRKVGYSPISKTFTNKSDAEKYLRLTELEIERKIFVDYAEAEATTLGEALTRYLREVTPSKKSALKEEYKIKTWLKHPLAKRSLASLKPIDFATYRDKRLTEVSAASVRLELGVISHLFNVARKDWSIEGLVNPLEGIRKPKVNNARNRRLTREEMGRLLEACKQSKSVRLHHLVTLGKV